MEEPSVSGAVTRYSQLLYTAHDVAHGNGSGLGFVHLKLPPELSDSDGPDGAQVQFWPIEQLLSRGGELFRGAPNDAHGRFVYTVRDCVPTKIVVLVTLGNTAHVIQIPQRPSIPPTLHSALAPLAHQHESNAASS